VLLVLLLGGAGAVGYALVRVPASSKGADASVATPPAPVLPAKVEAPIDFGKDPHDGVTKQPEPRNSGRSKSPDKPDRGNVSSPDRGDRGDRGDSLERLIARAQDQFDGNRWAAAENSYREILTKYEDELKTKDMLTKHAELRLRLARVLLERGNINNAKHYVRSVKTTQLASRDDLSEVLLVKTILEEDEDLLESKASYESLLKSNSARKEALEYLKGVNRKLGLDENDGVGPKLRK
jgi:hypothetical protein